MYLKIKMAIELHKERIAKKVDRRYFACEICGTEKVQDRWTYKSFQYIPDHMPKTTLDTCRKCVYREEFGSKTFRKQMKEKSLDTT